MINDYEAIANIPEFHKMESMDKISIIMPTYNSEEFIRATLDSVFTQSHQNFELIICDDGSTDKTIEVIKEYQKQYGKITLTHSPVNQGAAAARNQTLEHVDSRYVTLLDSDDLWDPFFLEKQLAFIKEKKVPFVYSSFNRIDEEGNNLLRPFIVPPELRYKDLLKTNSIQPITVLMDMEKIQNLHFPVEAVKREDLAAWLRVFKTFDHAAGNPEVLAGYRQRKGSISRNKGEMMYYQWLVYRKVEKIALLPSLYYLINWAVRGYLKYRK